MNRDDEIIIEGADESDDGKAALWILFGGCSMLILAFAVAIALIIWAFKGFPGLN